MDSNLLRQLLEVEGIKDEVLNRLRPKEWMDINDAAKYLSLSINTLYKYVSERKIPFRKIPGSSQVRFRKKHLDMWMETRGKIIY